MTLIEVRVPDLGSFKDVLVIDLLVKVGDTVELETPLVTLETEKATMDVPSSAAGVIESLALSRGGTANAGDLVAIVRAIPVVAATGQSTPIPIPTPTPAATSAAPRPDAPPAAPQRPDRKSVV